MKSSASQHSVEPKALQPYAIFETGGKQYHAQVGMTIEIEKLDAEPGAEVSFERVLLRRADENNVQVGAPYLTTPVTAEIIKHARGPKLIVYKMKRRKKQRTKNGHRQEHTIIRVKSI